MSHRRWTLKLYLWSVAKMSDADERRIAREAKAILGGMIEELRPRLYERNLRLLEEAARKRDEEGGQ
jgi:hypothetical protein